MFKEFNKKSLKIPKGQSESVYRRRTDNTMAKRKIKILLEKVPFYFGWGDRKLNIIHSRLRNMCGSLNADLHLEQKQQKTTWTGVSKLVY
jgi:hypothetical protein